MAKLKGPNPTLCIMSEKRVNPESKKKEKKKERKKFDGFSHKPIYNI